MLAAMGVGIAAGPASAETDVSMCIFVSPSQSTVVCAYNTPAGNPITMALEQAWLFSIGFPLGTSATYGRIEKAGDGDLCMQGLADRPYNGGWTVALETCANESGQLWKAVAGPEVHGYQSYYIVNLYNAAYCLAWDQNAGTLFANTCRNAWYQQIIVNN
jgi:hypothetical protein